MGAEGVDGVGRMRPLVALKPSLVFRPVLRDRVWNRLEMARRLRAQPPRNGEFYCGVTLLPALLFLLVIEAVSGIVSKWLTLNLSVMESFTAAVAPGAAAASAAAAA